MLATLSFYQYEDCGFGRALEPDAWNPNSTPIQTWTATEILREIDFRDGNHLISQSILRYLGSGNEFTGHSWLNTPKSNNDYPHAPWWDVKSDSTCRNSCNHTACFAGFIIRFASESSGLYQLGCQIASEAFHD